MPSRLSPLASRLSPLASRLSPLASRLSPLGVITALLVFLPVFLSGNRAAFASDWLVTYSPQNYGGSEDGLCGPNSVVSKSKSVTVIATLTWQGSGPAPKRVKVMETASVSWRASLTVHQDSQIRGEPPPEPDGNMSGTGSTGLTDTKVRVPNPWTNTAQGEDVTGAREGVYTVPDSGVFSLPPVTLTATGTASTGENTTGGASYTIGSYSASVPDGWANATATLDITPPTSGWLASIVDYGEDFDGSYRRDDGKPSITVSVGGGTKKVKDLNPQQTYTHQGSQDLYAFYGAFAFTFVSGEVSAVNTMIYAESSVDVGTGVPDKKDENGNVIKPGAPADDTSTDKTPASSSGHAPDNGMRSYGVGSGNHAYPKQAQHGPQGNIVVITARLHAKASTIGQ